MYSILIIEDDKAIRDELAVLLESFGYRAVVLDKFENVVEDIKGLSYNLILLDINLPNQNGFDEVQSFFRYIQYSFHLDLSLLINKIYCKIMKHFNKIANETILSIIATSVFHHLFYIPNNEPYYYNIEILSKNNISIEKLLSDKGTTF